MSLLLIKSPIVWEEAIHSLRRNLKSSVPYIILSSYSVNHLNKPVAARIITFFSRLAHIVSYVMICFRYQFTKGKIKQVDGYLKFRVSAHVQQPLQLHIFYIFKTKSHFAKTILMFKIIWAWISSTHFITMISACITRIVHLLIIILKYIHAYLVRQGGG